MAELRRFECSCGRTITVKSNTPDDNGDLWLRPHKRPDGRNCQQLKAHQPPPSTTPQAPYNPDVD